MTNKPIMSEEQCTAIENMIVRVAEWLPSIKVGGEKNKKAWELMENARQELRRLLVEPEQAIVPAWVCQKCGGVTHNPADKKTCKRTGCPLRYVPDPDLTTFGELRSGEWFATPVRDDWVFCKLSYKQGDGSTALELGAAIHHIFKDSDVIRRLPKPEFKA